MSSALLSVISNVYCRPGCTGAIFLACEHSILVETPGNVPLTLLLIVHCACFGQRQGSVDGESCQNSLFGLSCVTVVNIHVRRDRA